MNRTSHPVGFAAAFSGRQVDLELKPNQAFWQRQPNLKLESLTIRDGIERKDFSFNEIAAAFSRVSTDRLAAIAYVGGGRIAGITGDSLGK